MEAARSSRASSADREEPECDHKVRDAESAESTTSSEQVTGVGESSSRQASVPEAIPGRSGAIDPVDNDMEMVLRRKIDGLGNIRVPEMRMSGCSECEETDSDEDDDVCSTSSDESEDSYNPLASGVLPPVLPDIQLRVPMDDEYDVKRVKDALLMKGVLDVVCDEARQIVTITGVVPPSRLLKKVRKVKRQARIISTVSSFAVFVNPNFGSSAFAVHEEDSPRSSPIDIPSARPVSSFALHQQRPRPTFQRYTFRNDPRSPYLRTFSLADLSPPSSPESPEYVTGDAFDHHRRFDSSFVYDDLML